MKVKQSNNVVIPPSTILAELHRTWVDKNNNNSDSSYDRDLSDDSKNF